MEGKLCYGRTHAVCDPGQGREQCGLEGLSDRTRRPFRYANQLPEQVEAAIVGAKREKPHWGARKTRERLLIHS